MIWHGHDHDRRLVGDRLRWGIGIAREAEGTEAEAALPIPPHILIAGDPVTILFLFLILKTTHSRSSCALDWILHILLGLSLCYPSISILW